MTFDENYTKLPKVYKRAGKECYLDPMQTKHIRYSRRNCKAESYSISVRNRLPE